jgi:hypothetical protein
MTYATDEEALAKGEILFRINAGDGTCQLCVVKNPEGRDFREIFAFFPEVYASEAAALDGWLEKSKIRRSEREAGGQQ